MSLWFQLQFRKNILIFLCAIFLNGCATTPPTQNVPIANSKHIIYVIYRGWHTSLLLDAKSFAAQSPMLKKDLQGQKFARVGWGDGDYFTGKNKSWSTAAKALVASGYSALQLLLYAEDPFDEIPAEKIVPVAITDQGLRNLIVYINSSIALDEQGKPISLLAYLEDTGLFFQATDHYSAFSNCNTWSGHALRAAGLPVSSRLTASGVFSQAKAISRIQANEGVFEKLKASNP